MSRDLVIARVGANSLHPGWMDPGRERPWDLHLVPFEPVPGGGGTTSSEVIKGPKWSGLREVLEGWDGWREYDYIWLPDDDIATDQDTITRMFAIAREVGLDLFAPALHEESFYAHFDTMRNDRFAGRWTGFVEIMTPGFSRAALEELHPTLRRSPTGWGWGLDSLWPKLLGYENIGVIDATPVLHTKPVGRMRDPELAERVRAESDAIFAQDDCRQVHTTFAAFGDDFERLELSPEELLVELVGGWEYLIARDPRLLAWIAEYQRGSFPTPPYPVEGTPEVTAASTSAAASSA
jgi:hypothetical protein